MEFKKVTKNIYNESYYDWLEENMNYKCFELLQQKIPSLKDDDLELRYNLSYSQWSWVRFTKFNISFNELIKYLLETKTLTQKEYDILYAAHDEWLYDVSYHIWSWNRVEVNTQIYNIEDDASKTYSLLKQYKNDEVCIDEDDNSQYFAWETLDDILSEDEIKLALEDLLDSVSEDLESYWYSYIESEDEYQCKNILFDSFMELNNIEHNIEYHEWWEYLRTKKEVLDELWILEHYTLVNDNNLNYYYISNGLLKQIEQKERTIKYYSLTI